MHHGRTPQEYKTAVRNLAANLKRNEELRGRVCRGELAAHGLVRLSPKELATQVRRRRAARGGWVAPQPGRVARPTVADWRPALRAPCEHPAGPGARQRRLASVQGRRRHGPSCPTLRCVMPVDAEARPAFKEWEGNKQCQEWQGQARPLTHTRTHTTRRLLASPKRCFTLGTPTPRTHNMHRPASTRPHSP